MLKVNSTPLLCIHQNCAAIPTVVFEFRQPNGERVICQIITCTDHTQEGIDRGGEMFERSNLFTTNYPRWLRILHDEVLRRRTIEGASVTDTDVERLRAFRTPISRRSAERL